MKSLSLLLTVLFCFISCAEDEGGNQEVFSVAALDATTGKVGTTINITGTGFGESIADITVSFGSVPAEVISVTPINIQVNVPNGSTFGPLEVTLLNETATNKPNFTTENYIDDRNQDDYPLVYIGDQVWFGKSLNFDSESGDTCYQEEENNCETDGRFYTRTTALTACPDGWILPEKLDFEELLVAVEFDKGRVLRQGGESGFDIVLSGTVKSELNNEGNLVFDGKGEWADFWTTTIHDTEDLSYLFQYTPGSTEFFTQVGAEYYACVRCLKN